MEALLGASTGYQARTITPICPTKGVTISQILPAAVLLLTGLTLLNLTLTLAVIRRLREANDARLGESDLPEIGRKVAAFSAATVDGRKVTADWMDPIQLVLFLSAGCRPCVDAVDRLDLIETLPEHTMAFVAGDPDDQAVGELVKRLQGRLSVAIDRGDLVARAFGVHAYPTALAVSDGVIRAAAYRLEDVLEAELAGHRD